MAKFVAWILAVLFIVISGSVIFEAVFQPYSRIKYGVTFSPRYASYLKLDWQKTYIRMLDELKVRNLRIPSYWDSVEPESGKYNFSETDYMLNEAGKKDAKVILVLGEKQPRWPECQIPGWARNLKLNDRKQKILELVQKVVERYKDRPEIWAWQVENEPFVFWFGENCDPQDKKFLQEEISLVKKLDTKRPVIVTDSGEWSDWASAMTFSDILGVSLYRKAYNKTFNQYITYPFPSWMYSLKSNLVRKLYARENLKTIVSELQTEPWFQKSILETPLEEQLKLFSVDEFKGNVQHAKKTGFEEAYFWGVEWWYYMAAHGHPEYLDYAATLFK